MTSLLLFAPVAQADVLPEYRLKAAFLYNFATFTQWPPTVGRTLNVCVHGPNPFGSALGALHGKAVGTRRIVVPRPGGGQPLKECQVLFISAPAIGDLPRLLKQLGNTPVLTVAESPGAASAGVALNMAVAQNRITFEANPAAARAAQLVLSSKLLRLATQVH
ncbi:YfiR family protein [Lysobacter koreensis]|uniref:YfiR family protein n=1 Tax=Lysobacter koreensis TaxID=266122 RepID=A0ABW2YLF8_9GAMM